MCGLFGGFDTNFLSTGERDLIRQLGVLSLFRGIHSSGLAHCWTKSKRKSNVIKSTTTSPELLYGQETEELFTSARLECNLLFGHTRHATVGAKTIVNAHPFVFSQIIGVHNGTIPCLRNDDSKENPHELSDSYFLYERINKEGLDPVIKSLSEWHSAYALVMYDKKVNHLRFLRNKERPLYYAITNSGMHMWSSTSLNLEYLIRNNGIANAMTKEGIKELPENLVHTFDFNTNKWLTPYKLEPEKKVYAMGRAWEDYEYVGSGQDWKHSGWWSSKTNDQEKPKEVQTVPHTVVPRLGPPLSAKEISEQGKSSYSDDEYFYRGYKNQAMTISQAAKLLAKGDAYWAMPRDITEAVLWIGPEEFILYKDKDDQMVKDYLITGSTYTGRICRRERAKEVA